MVSAGDGATFGPGDIFGELTPREQEVAGLIVEGLTNEEIAQKLTLTTGTVANHVAHILAKTGARSRVQVAVKLARSHPVRSVGDVLALLTALQLLGPVDLCGALQHATEVLASFFGGDLSEAFVYDPGTETLVAVASSQTALAERQRALDLHYLPLSHGGRVAWVFQQQQAFLDGRVEEDAFELISIRRDLGVRSTLAVPFAVSADRRGVLVVRSVEPDHFAEPDRDLLQFVAYWVALVAQQHTESGIDHAGRHEHGWRRRSRASQFLNGSSGARDPGDGV